MEYNLVCNHTSDEQNQMTARQESSLSITRLVWLQTELDGPEQRKKLDIGYTLS